MYPWVGKLGLVLSPSETAHAVLGSDWTLSIGIDLGLPGYYSLMVVGLPDRIVPSWGRHRGNPLYNVSIRIRPILCSACFDPKLRYNPNLGCHWASDKQAIPDLPIVCRMAFPYITLVWTHPSK